MIEIAVPGWKDLTLEHLLLDYNGTLACDGRFMEELRAPLTELADRLTLHVVTADTHGTVSRELEGLPCRLVILPPEGIDRGKLAFLRSLGCDRSACIGNGRNDALMLREAALGIAVLQQEGASVQTLTAADIAAPGIEAALNLLLHPKRLIATLRC